MILFGQQRIIIVLIIITCIDAYNKISIQAY